MTIEQLHPAINAALNLTSFVFLIAGRIAIARGDDATHRRRMLTAFTASGVFLVSYLIRFATTGAHKYPGEGWDKTLYLVILFSHMVFAVLLVPLVIGALRRALRGNFPAHKKIVKFTWPIWVYVSITGVFVYLMLYHLAPVLHPTALTAVTRLDVLEARRRCHRFNVIIDPRVHAHSGIFVR